MTQQENLAVLLTCPSRPWLSTALHQNNRFSSFHAGILLHKRKTSVVGHRVDMLGESSDEEQSLSPNTEGMKCFPWSHTCYCHIKAAWWCVTGGDSFCQSYKIWREAITANQHEPVTLIFQSVQQSLSDVSEAGKRQTITRQNAFQSLRGRDWASLAIRRRLHIRHSCLRPHCPKLPGKLHF